MVVSICIGSSCHLKGSYDIIECFQKLVAEYDLANQVELNAAFCLGRCQDGVTIKVDDLLVTGVNKDNAKEIFDRHVLGALKEKANS